MIGNKNNKQKGQALLIIVIFLSVVLNSVLSLSYKSVTETQITKLEEESAKALQGVISGINALLQEKKESNNQIDISSLPGFSNLTGEAVVQKASKSTFVTNFSLKAGEQYTFYLADFDYSKPFPLAFSNYWNGNLDIYFGSSSLNSCSALELTFIKSDNSFEKKVIDPCGKIADLYNLKILTSQGEKIEEVNFAYKTNSPISIFNTRLLIVRIIYGDTKLGLKGNKNLPVQGIYIYSEAQSSAGVNKKGEFFQSYPQIPAEFFVTSF